MIDIQDIIIEPRFKNLMALNSFFEILDREQPKPMGTVLHDKNDLPIDCNIYAPKYGGFDKTINGKTIRISYGCSSLENHVGYTAPNGQSIVCRWYLPCICIEEDEISHTYRFFHKDGEQVFKKPFIQNSSTTKRTAENEADFEQIYRRELDRLSISDNKAVRDLLTDNVKSLLDFEKSLPTEQREWSIHLQDKANEFLKWMEAKGNTKEKEITAPAVALFCRIMSNTIREKPPYETNESYCQNLCADFNLPYNDKVRQWYSNQPKNKHFSDLRKIVIPLLDKETAQIITDYLTVNSTNK